MRRINTADHRFTEGNPALGIPATVPRDWWFNLSQEEIAKAIEGFGVTLDDTGANDHQLRDALLAALAAKADVSNVLPIGVVVPHGASTAPAGFLECNGSAISRTTYAALFAQIGTVHGVGDGASTFNIPDLRGEFIRGWDHTRGADPDAAARTGGSTVGSKQSDQFKSHTHTTPHANNIFHVDNTAGTNNTAGSASDTTSAAGGNETRPRNVNMMYCIKY